MGEITASRVNRTRAVGLENFANTSPVTSAVSVRPTMASATTSVFAASDSGYIAPYPIVPMVCALKKKASANEPERACATPPVARNPSAKTASATRNDTAIKTSVMGHESRMRP